jgi:hypothetical protein
MQRSFLKVLVVAVAAVVLVAIAAVIYPVINSVLATLGPDCLPPPGLHDVATIEATELAAIRTRLASEFPAARASKIAGRVLTLTGQFEISNVDVAMKLHSIWLDVYLASHPGAQDPIVLIYTDGGVISEPRCAAP